MRGINSFVLLAAAFGKLPLFRHCFTLRTVGVISMFVVEQTLLFSASVEADYFETEGINGVFTAPKVEGQDIVTWCTTSIPEQAKCEKLIKIAQLDRGLFGSDYIELQCKRVRKDNICKNYKELTN